MKSLAAFCLGIAFLSACTSHRLDDQKAKNALQQYITDHIDRQTWPTITIDSITSPVIAGDNRSVQFQWHSTSVPPVRSQMGKGQARFQLAQDGKSYLTFIQDGLGHAQECQIAVK
jgi:hypothetical protein